MRQEIIEKTEAFVRHEMGGDATGHDWYHIERVRRNALAIWREEHAGDPFTIEMAALLHDIPDEKLNVSAEKGAEKLESFLETLNLSTEDKLHIKNIIFTISYKGGAGTELETIEAKIVQDADRLDAIGAIGVARAFAYGGKKGQPIYDPEVAVRDKMTHQEYRNGKSSSVNHFYEKLLKLKEKMNTAAASRMAARRHEWMEQFLQQFYSEWNGQQ